MRFKPAHQAQDAKRVSRNTSADAKGFDFTSHIYYLCHDACTRLAELQHIDMQRVAVTFSQTRKQVSHGLYASMTPMRFEGGSLQDLSLIHI